MEKDMKHEFGEYTREQLYQIIENKDQEIDYWFSQLHSYLTIMSILLFVFILCIFFAWLMY